MKPRADPVAYLAGQLDAAHKALAVKLAAATVAAGFRNGRARGLSRDQVLDELGAALPADGLDDPEPSDDGIERHLADVGMAGDVPPLAMHLSWAQLRASAAEVADQIAQMATKLQIDPAPADELAVALSTNVRSAAGPALWALFGRVHALLRAMQRAEASATPKEHTFDDELLVLTRRWIQAGELEHTQEDAASEVGCSVRTVRRSQAWKAYDDARKRDRSPDDE